MWKGLRILMLFALDILNLVLISVVKMDTVCIGNVTVPIIMEVMIVLFNVIIIIMYTKMNV